ncbi:MAG TPA: PorV/PorQ family protein [Chitinophagales bacterium]|nr:PorV/PorQ family protein [Chitinophagales bacterium]HNL85098.1 PorV/PorQ family protein [Chitinophagales bacterium]
MIKQKGHIYLLLVVIILGIYTASAKPPKYSNDFMYIGVGANNFGLGNAVVANTGDITSGYWNPAGLVRIQTNLQFAYMHNEYFASIAKYDYAGIGVPLDSNKHAFAINFMRFGVDDIPNTLDLIDADGTVNYDNVKNFSVGNYAFLLSYARNIIKGLSVGATAKIVHNKAGGFAKSWGFGVDIGAIYQIKDWKIGLTVKDITTTFNAWSFSFTDKEKQILDATDNVIPVSSTELTLPRIQFGASYNKTFKDKIELMAELDWELTTDGKRNTLISSKAISLDPRLGVELGLWKIGYLRGGISNFQKMTNLSTGKQKFTVQPSIGVGLRYKNIVYLDYAFTDVGKTSENQYSHVISLKVGINKRKHKENAELINAAPQENVSGQEQPASQPTEIQSPEKENNNNAQPK